jgi:hypothetical protein
MPKAISISRVPGKPGQVYYPLSLDEVSKPTPRPTELVIKIHAYVKCLLSTTSKDWDKPSVPIFGNFSESLTDVQSEAPPLIIATFLSGSTFTQLSHLGLPCSPMAAALSLRPAP